MLQFLTAQSTLLALLYGALACFAVACGIATIGYARDLLTLRRLRRIGYLPRLDARRFARDFRRYERAMRRHERIQSDIRIARRRAIAAHEQRISH